MDQKTLIEYLIDEENRAIHLYRKCATEERDREMRSFLMDLSVAKEKHKWHLEEKRRSLDASDSVTRQINDVYL